MTAVTALPPGIFGSQPSKRRWRSRPPRHLSCWTPSREFTPSPSRSIRNRRSRSSPTGETQALLDAITADTWTGRRDRVMFTLAVQTGLRLSEITELCLASVHLGAAPHVACTGKGRKNRTTPLTSTTASLLKVYSQERSTRPGQALFPNPHGFALSADAVQRRLSLHLVKATSICPDLANKHVTVHTLRHTAAMRFLEAGIDAAVIALWLGHESQATTSIYLHADMRHQTQSSRTHPPARYPRRRVPARRPLAHMAAESVIMPMQSSPGTTPTRHDTPPVGITPTSA